MDLHTDREIHLSEESEHKSLYSWFLHEPSSDGQKKGAAQVPWVWKNYFTATKVSIHRTVEIESPGHKRFGLTDLEDGEPDISAQQEAAGEVRETEAITATLVPGRVLDGNMDDDTRYSMFGTNRTIKKFSLRVLPLSATEDAQERCHAWGSVSYTTDMDFRDVTFEDELQFSVLLKQERFDRLKAAVAASEELLIDLAGVSGFYSDWSPSISTSRIKVLTRDTDHAVSAPEGVQVTPPRLGRVAEVNVTTTTSRKLDLEIRQSEPDVEADEVETEKHTDPGLSSRDQIFLAKLDQLGRFPVGVKFALWGILVSLVLLILK